MSIRLPEQRRAPIRYIPHTQRVVIAHRGETRAIRQEGDGVDVIAAMQSCDVWKQKTDITAPQSPKDLSDSELGALIRSGKLTDIETVELLRNSMKPVSHFEEHDTETK